MTDRVLLSCSLAADAPPYLEALKTVGIGPERVQVLIARPEDRLEDYRALVVDSAALLLGGGHDLDPTYYGEAPDPEAKLQVFPERDRAEWALLEAARERRLPVWGICRGMQLLNVFFGGNLWQDLPRQVPGALDHDGGRPHDGLSHGLTVVEPGSVTGTALGAEPMRVNSRHHQAVRQMALELDAVALSPDGLVEALALPRADWWVEGVQWHPENLIALAQQRALWTVFAKAVDRFVADETRMRRAIPCPST